MGNMIRVQAVRRGQYGSNVVIDPKTGLVTRSDHKLYDPVQPNGSGSMGAEECIFFCKEEDFSDADTDRVVVRDGKKVHLGPGWMRRLGDPAPVAPAPLPVQPTIPAPAKRAKKEI